MWISDEIRCSLADVLTDIGPDETSRGFRERQGIRPPIRDRGGRGRHQGCRPLIGRNGEEELEPTQFKVMISVLALTLAWHLTEDISEPVHYTLYTEDRDKKHRNHKIFSAQLKLFTFSAEI